MDNGQSNDSDQMEIGCFGQNEFDSYWDSISPAIENDSLEQDLLILHNHKTHNNKQKLALHSANQHNYPS